MLRLRGLIALWCACPAQDQASPRADRPHAPHRQGGDRGERGSVTPLFEHRWFLGSLGPLPGMSGKGCFAVWLGAGATLMGGGGGLLPQRLLFPVPSCTLNALTETLTRLLSQRIVSVL